QSARTERSTSPTRDSASAPGKARSCASRPDQNERPRASLTGWPGESSAIQTSWGAGRAKPARQPLTNLRFEPSESRPPRQWPSASGIDDGNGGSRQHSVLAPPKRQGIGNVVTRPSARAPETAVPPRRFTFRCGAAYLYDLGPTTWTR